MCGEESGWYAFMQSLVGDHDQKMCKITGHHHCGSSTSV